MTGKETVFSSGHFFAHKLIYVLFLTLKVSKLPTIVAGWGAVFGPSVQ